MESPSEISFEEHRILTRTIFVHDYNDLLSRSRQVFIYGRTVSLALVLVASLSFGGELFAAGIVLCQSIVALAWVFEVVTIRRRRLSLIMRIRELDAEQVSWMDAGIRKSYYERSFLDEPIMRVWEPLAWMTAMLSIVLLVFSVPSWGASSREGVSGGSPAARASSLQLR
jgi:hypothetical protein